MMNSLLIVIAFAGIAVTLLALPIIFVQFADHRSELEELTYRVGAESEPVAAQYPDPVDIRSTDDGYLEFAEAHRSAA